MDSNTHSISQPPGQSAGPPGGRRDRLAALAAEVEALAAQDLGGLTEVALAEEVLELRRLLDRLGAAAGPVAHDPNGQGPPLAQHQLKNPGAPNAAAGRHGPVAPDPGRRPTQPLDVGRASRVVQPAQRTALAIRDGGWRLIRGPDGRLTASPPHRRHPTARRHPSTAA
jgi:hypothetical protein